MIDTFTFFSSTLNSSPFMTIADQIQKIRLKLAEACVQCGREVDRVTLMAVSKTHPAGSIQAAYESGITNFGESYLQDALVKIEALNALPLSWHFIGPLQSNKTRAVATHFAWVHSVDREKILQRLSDQRPDGLKPLQVCIQVNYFAEPQKQGVTRENLPALLAKATQLPHIQLRGIMVIPPAKREYAEQLAQFKSIENLYQELRQQYPDIDTLSMGMSGDLAAAIAAGSNCIRVGTAIFGPRGTHHQATKL